MLGIGTGELIVMLVIAAIMLRRSFGLPSSDLINVLSRGFRALFGIEDADRDDSFTTADDIVAALLVIALVTITAACIVAMLEN